MRVVELRAVEDELLELLEAGGPDASPQAFDLLIYRREYLLKKLHEITGRSESEFTKIAREMSELPDEQLSSEVGVHTLSSPQVVRLLAHSLCDSLARFVL